MCDKLFIYRFFLRNEVLMNNICFVAVTTSSSLKAITTKIFKYRGRIKNDFQFKIKIFPKNYNFWKRWVSVYVGVSMSAWRKLYMSGKFSGKGAVVPLNGSHFGREEWVMPLVTCRTAHTATADLSIINMSLLSVSSINWARFINIFFYLFDCMHLFRI